VWYSNQDNALEQDDFYEPYDSYRQAQEEEMHEHSQEEE
jgi:hypothetical protein